MNRNKRRWLLLLATVATVIAIDQLSKWLVIDNLMVGESTQPIPALGKVFQFTHSANTGAAFGLLSGMGDIFIFIAPIVSIGLIWYYPRIPDPATLTRLAFGLIVGGALGNVIDRLQHEHVVDFIHYRIPGLISNVSNLADHAIVLGVLMIFIDSWLQERRENQAKEAAAQGEDAESHAGD